MSTAVNTPIKNKPMTINAAGVVSIAEKEVRPLLPETAAIVDMLGASESVTNQFAEIAKNGRPVKTKPRISAPPSTGPIFLLIHT